MCVKTYAVYVRTVTVVSLACFPLAAGVLGTIGNTWAIWGWGRNKLATLALHSRRYYTILPLTITGHWRVSDSESPISSGDNILKIMLSCNIIRHKCCIVFIIFFFSCLSSCIIFKNGVSLMLR